MQKAAVKVLCYTDIALTILRNPESGKQDLIVRNITLFHTKEGLGSG